MKSNTVGIMDAFRTHCSQYSDSEAILAKDSPGLHGEALAKFTESMLARLGNFRSRPLGRHQIKVTRVQINGDAEDEVVFVAELVNVTENKAEIKDRPWGWIEEDGYEITLRLAPKTRIKSPLQIATRRH